MRKRENGGKTGQGRIEKSGCKSGEMGHNRNGKLR